MKCFMHDDSYQHVNAQDPVVSLNKMVDAVMWPANGHLKVSKELCPPRGGQRENVTQQEGELFTVAPVQDWQMRHMLASHLDSSRWSLSLSVSRRRLMLAGCCLGSLIADTICSFCHGSALQEHKTNTRRGEKNPNNLWSCTSPPPPFSLPYT